jgi:hypothetical protein
MAHWLRMIRLSGQPIICTACMAVVAINSALGLALPMSSLARITMRRAMNIGSSPTFHHARQPIDGGVRVAAAHALDERADDVVVLFALLVVAGGSGLHHLRVPALSVMDRASRRVLACTQSSKVFSKRRASPPLARIKRRRSPQRHGHGCFSSPASVAISPASAGPSGRSSAKGFKHVHLAAGKQGADHLEAGVLRGGTDQGDGSLLHGAQQGVLLGLAEPVDLVDEQHGACAEQGPIPPAFSITSRTSFTPLLMALSVWNGRSSPGR